MFDADLFIATANGKSTMLLNDWYRAANEAYAELGMGHGDTVALESKGLRTVLKVGDRNWLIVEWRVPIQ